MKFNSRKDSFFYIVVYGLILFMAVMIVISLGKNSEFDWVSTVIMIGIILLLLWVFYGTHYVLTKEELKYRSGPFRGTIKLQSIMEIVVGKTLWVGLKPATARKGLIIRYGKTFLNDIYITPKTNKDFIHKIVLYNPHITIIEKR